MPPLLAPLHHGFASLEPAPAHLDPGTWEHDRGKQQLLLAWHASICSVETGVLWAT